MSSPVGSCGAVHCVSGANISPMVQAVATHFLHCHVIILVCCSYPCSCARVCANKLLVPVCDARTKCRNWFAQLHLPSCGHWLIPIHAVYAVFSLIRV